MSRLSSLRGPSAPSTSPSSPLTPSPAFPSTSLHHPSPTSPSPTKSSHPSQPASVDPSPQHRKVRAVVQEVERTLRDWQAVVSVDAARAGKAVVDARTELDNLAIAHSTHAYPHEPSTLPSDLLARLAQASDDLSRALLKLDKRLAKLATLSTAADQLVLDSLRTRGSTFTSSTALWTTWSVEDFAASLSPLLASLHHSHTRLLALARALLSPACSFAAGKAALEDLLREGSFEEAWKGPAGGWVKAGGGGGGGGGGGVGGRGRGGGEGRGAAAGRREWAECMQVEVIGWDEAFRVGGGSGR